MIIELRIRNLAVIERASVTLGAGLNALTGETGAGKSIIVGALSLLLGERASAAVVRPGADKATVEGVFDVSGNERLIAALDEQGVGVEDGLLILRREVAAEGRNRAWVNGLAATASVVGGLGRLLVDLHGQHEHQSLIRPAEQRAILDAFGDAQPAAARVAAAYEECAGLKGHIADLASASAAAEERATELRGRVTDVQELDIEAGEDAALEAEGRLLEHSEELAALAAGAHEALYEAEDSIVVRLDAQRRALARLQAFDPERTEDARALETVYFELQELGRRLGDYATRLEHDPQRLEDIRTRRDLLFRLKRRYGVASSDDLLEIARAAREELAGIENSGLRRQQAERALADAQDGLDEAAKELTRLRRDASRALEAKLRSVLPALGLAGRFGVDLPDAGEVTRSGAESVEFAFAPNAGFDARPLSRIASGGELSRVMLALKTVLAAVDRVPTLVFDEIDAGVGGEVAVRIADALHDVGRRHQVLVITHLPQIAARADHHVWVEKEVHEGTTLTRVEALDGQGRLEELARMLGDSSGEAARRHAADLLSPPAPPPSLSTP
ncbi:MAG: DNA repair protein RecN [Gemmatimonadota bacterium]